MILVIWQQRQEHSKENMTITNQCVIIQIRPQILRFFKS